LEDREGYKKVIEGCKRNDRKAQEQLYQQFLGPMWSICRRYISNEAEAMEVMNDGYLKVFKNISKYDPSLSGLYTWMSRIMINTAIDFIRKQKALKYIPMENLEHEESAEADDLLDHYNEQQLLLFINQLPETTRIVFNLHAIEDFSHKEIAAYLKITESTSRWHLTEARKRLKKIVVTNGR
jgi:RNA polymerase sigma-70 factor (ECF subfamily)